MAPWTSTRVFPRVQNFGNFARSAPGMFEQPVWPLEISPATAKRAPKLFQLSLHAPRKFENSRALCPGNSIRGTKVYPAKFRCARPRSRQSNFRASDSFANDFRAGENFERWKIWRTKGPVWRKLWAEIHKERGFRNATEGSRNSTTHGSIVPESHPRPPGAASFPPFPRWKIMHSKQGIPNACPGTHHFFPLPRPFDRGEISLSIMRSRRIFIPLPMHVSLAVSSNFYGSRTPAASAFHAHWNETLKNFRGRGWGVETNGGFYLCKINVDKIDRGIRGLL